MKETKTLKEVFPNYLYNPLWFAKMIEAPWYNEIPAQQLAIKYIGQRSGSRITSPLLDDLVENTEPDINTIIANIFTSCEMYRWKKLWETLNYDYNPIENYNMTETSDDTRNSVTDNTDTTTDEITNTTTSTIENASNVDNTVYGFNSPAKVGSDGSNETSSGSSTATSQNVSTNTQTGKSNLSDTNTHKLTRSGNIGVTTTQEMITQERELVIWKFFDDVVFADMDKYLVCPIYK